MAALSRAWGVSTALSLQDSRSDETISMGVPGWQTGHVSLIQLWVSLPRCQPSCALHSRSQRALHSSMHWSLQQLQRKKEKQEDGELVVSQREEQGICQNRGTLKGWTLLFQPGARAATVGIMSHFATLSHLPGRGMSPFFWTHTWEAKDKPQCFFSLLNIDKS